MPDSVRIELSEIERAHKSGNDFYLAVVAGLKDDYDKVIVRLFASPLTTFDWQANTSVTLLGIDRKHAVDVVFEGS